MSHLVHSKAKILKETEETIHSIIQKSSLYPTEIQHIISRYIKFRFVPQEVDSSSGLLLVSISEFDDSSMRLPHWEINWNIYPATYQTEKLISLLLDLGSFLVSMQNDAKPLSYTA